MDLTELLAFVSDKGVRPAPVLRAAPMIRVHGDVRRINVPPLEHKDVHGMIYDIMNDGQRSLRGKPRVRLLVSRCEPGPLQG